MTVDEAIEFEKESIKGERQMFADGGSAWYHEQLVKWLEELKDYRNKNKLVVKVDVMNIPELREKINEAYNQGRADAADDIYKSM